MSDKELLIVQALERIEKEVAGQKEMTVSCPVRMGVDSASYTWQFLNDLTTLTVALRAHLDAEVDLGPDSLEIAGVLQAFSTPTMAKKVVRQLLRERDEAKIINRNLLHSANDELHEINNELRARVKELEVDVEDNYKQGQKSGFNIGYEIGFGDCHNGHTKDSHIARKIWEGAKP